MDLKIEGAVVTDAGKKRRNNEDNYYFFGSCRYDLGAGSRRETKTVMDRCQLAAVFDGMGGEEAGEEAALIAAKAFAPCSLERIKDEAACQARNANEAICREMEKQGGIRMGTTAVLLYIDGGKAVCCNIGDSRCYLMRKGLLRQLSMDHSEAESMVRMGILEREKARESKGWHRLTQHLGIFPDEFVIEPYFSQEVSLEEQDIFLLCSDGLTDMVPDGQLAELLKKGEGAKKTAQGLMEAALEHGGKDNVTVMVLCVGF